MGPQPLEDVQPVEVGDVQVEDHDVGTHAIEHLEARLGGAGALHVVADPVEVVADGAQHVAVVIDEQDAVSHGAARPAARSRDPR